MVLFVTGICPKDCFYCPVSDDRRTDTTYANERKVLSDQDLLEEARQMDALGTGITGGEPLLKMEKVIHYIKLLKKEFGPQHHIHLYTSTAPDMETLNKLSKAGLDEIRFHPPVELWDRMDTTSYADSIDFAKELGMEAGIEIPSIEGADKMALFAEKIGCFLNLNELEFSDTNTDAMKAKGYTLRDYVSNAVIGSEEYAAEIAHNCEMIHFCSSSYKDAIQLRNRLIRIAENTARPFDEISEDGTIFYGHIECATSDEIEIVNNELLQMEVAPDMMGSTADGIDIAWWILENLAESIRTPIRKLYILERYPLKDGLIVEKIPL